MTITNVALWTYRIMLQLSGDGVGEDSSSDLLDILTDNTNQFSLDIDSVSAGWFKLFLFCNNLDSCKWCMPVCVWHMINGWCYWSFLLVSVKDFSSVCVLAWMCVHVWVCACVSVPKCWKNYCPSPIQMKSWRDCAMRCPDQSMKILPVVWKEFKSTCTHKRFINYSKIIAFVIVILLFFCSVQQPLSTTILDVQAV